MLPTLVPELLAALARRPQGGLAALAQKRLDQLQKDGLLTHWGARSASFRTAPVVRRPPADFFLEVFNAYAAPAESQVFFVGRALWQLQIESDHRYICKRRISPSLGNQFLALSNEKLINVTSQIELQPATPTHPAILAPSPLFSPDFLAPHLYPGEVAGLRKDAHLAFLSALDALEPLFGIKLADIRAVIHTIALTGRLPIKGRTSYSCRVDYPGVVFLDASMESALDICEALVHEFIHQALWLDAALNPDGWLPSSAGKIKSPATGRELDVAVMTHAALIYAIATQMRLQSNQNSAAQASAQWSIELCDGLAPAAAGHHKTMEVLTAARAMASLPSVANQSKH